jgi:hypothetical protein
MQPPKGRHSTIQSFTHFPSYSFSIKAYISIQLMQIILRDVQMRAGQFLPFIFFLLFISCDSTEPEPPKDEPEPIVKSITLSADKFTCTEVWLSVSSENLVLPRNALVYRGDSLIEQISLNKPDTLLYYDGLLPAKDYIFRMTIPEDTVESNTAAFRTLDTTSHNFTYQTWEFGDFNNSVLYDVAIINENNIWAVGEIFLNDSLGNYDPTRYNTAHWNGSHWKILRIKWIYQGTTITNILKSVFAFDENNVWFCGNGLIKWNGLEFVAQPISSQVWGPYMMNKMWGRSSSDLYIVGNSGSIAHYNGVQWQKIESGTDLNLTDVFGNTNGEIYIAGASIQYVKGVLLKNSTSNTFETMITSEIIDESQLFEKLYGSIYSVWMDENNTLFSAGSFLFRYKNNRWDFTESLQGNCLNCNAINYRGYFNSVRGNGSNDYVVAGERNTLLHFNGNTWMQLGLPYSPTSSISWYEVAQKNDVIVTVGVNNRKSKIMMLKR